MNQLQKKYKLTKSQISHLKELSSNLEKYSKDVLKNLSKIEELLDSGITVSDISEAGFESSIELFHGVGSYDLICENLMLHNSYKEDDYEFTTIFSNWDDALSTRFSVQSDDSESRMYESIWEEKIYEEHEVIFFKWFCKLWHEKRLFRYPINAGTLQNNSVEQFDLNRCIWVNFLPTQERDSFDNGEEYIHLFNRPLSDFEIESRIRIKNTSKFVTYWRHLKNKDNYISFGLYNNEYRIIEHDGTFKDINEIERGVCEKRFSVLLKCSSFTTNKILEGYEEVRIDNCPGFDENTIDFDTIEFLGISNLTESELSKLYENIDFELPISYKKFILKFHKQKFVDVKIAFPLNKYCFKEFNAFLWCDSQNYLVEINNEKYLRIANTKDNYFVLLNQDGKIFLQIKSELLHIFNDFEDFIQSFFGYCCIDECEVFYAKKGDVEFFKKYLKNNYVDNKFGWEHTILSYALPHFDLVKFLLENDANPNKIRIPYRKGLEKTLMLLRDYNYDPSIETCSLGLDFDDIFEEWNYKEIFKDLKFKNNKIKTKIPNRKRRIKDYFTKKKLIASVKGEIPREIINFIFKHGGEKANNKWLKLGFGCFLKIDRFFEPKEVLNIVNFNNQNNLHWGHFSLVPIGKTISYETIYFELIDDKPCIVIENQYEVNGYDYMRTLSKRGEFIDDFLSRLYNEDTLFIYEAKAILNNDLNYIENMLSKGWNPNHPLNPHGTPLGLAMYLDHFDMVDLLLDNGAEIASAINDTNCFYKGNKPLDIAMLLCSKKMVRHIIDRGVLEFDTNSDYLKKAKLLIEKNRRSYLKEFLPFLEKNMVNK